MKCLDYNLLGLDTSTSSTGWSLFVNGKYQESGVVDLKIKNSAERMKQMVIEINKLIEHYSPTAIAIETPVVVRNPQVQRMLTMVFGAVYTICILNDIEFQEIRPAEWRFLVDSGKKPRKREELKEWSKQKVKELFDKDVTDDESDAILIGQAFFNLLENHGGD